MLQQASRFCDAMAAPNATPRWLVLAGKSGTGKTHLARCIYQWFRSHLWRTSYVTTPGHIASRDGNFYLWPSCVDRLRAGRYSLLDGMTEDWFCVVDDIGSERDPSGFSPDNLLKVLNGREKKWTVVTSNLTVSQIGEKMDNRIASRLIRNHSVVVDCCTKDWGLR